MVKDFLNDNSIVTQSAGEMLRQARLSKKLSISDLSKETRISKSMIDALEKGNPELLPGRTYETGYIRLICNALNEEYELITDLWIREHHTSKNKTQYVFPENKIKEKNISFPMVGLLVLLFLLILYGAWFFYSAQRNEGDLTILGINDLPVTINDTSKINSDIISNNKLKETPLSEEIITETASSKNQLMDETTNKNVDKNIDKIETLNDEVINLKGLDDSWLQVYFSSGELFYSGILKKEQILDLPQTKDFIVSMGNAGLVAIKSNNTKYSTIGQKGEIIQSQKLEEIIKVIDEEILLNQN